MNALSGPIVLLTDFGDRDFYAGVMKGVILNLNPEAVLIDLCHRISPQDILQAAHQIGISYRFFPRSTVFCCVVDPGVGTKRKAIAIRTPDYFFVGPDNGIFSFVLERERRWKARQITSRKFILSEISPTFHGRDIFAPVAAHLSKEGNPCFQRLGPPIPQVNRLSLPAVKKTRDCLRGAVIYFDHFGNGVTNLRKEDADIHFWRKARVQIGARRLGDIRSAYQSKSRGLIALWNSSDHLEISRPFGSARASGIHVGQSVHVTGD